MMDDRFIWPCLNKANEIAQIIETVEDKHASMIEGDLAELKITINLVRSTLVPFLTSPVNDVAFDVCVQGVKHTVDQIRKLMDQLDAVVPTPEWLNRKIALYKLDFLLKQKLDQFSTLFPQDGPSKGANMILDPDAREFWKTSFGEKMLLVPWSTFFHALESKLNTSLTADEAPFKAHLDFTLDGFVTPFEFNTFLEWFGPLKNSHKRLLQPLKAGMLSGFIPAIEANELLKNKPAGTYLIRYSKTHPGSFAVTFVYKRSKIKHCLLHSVPPAGVTLKNPPQVYPSLMDFAQAHASKLRQPVGTQWSQDASGAQLPSMLPSLPEEAGAGRAQSGFSELGAKSEGDPDLCSVCMDRKIQTVFLECGHLACCKECSKRLRDCPICRRPISRVVLIYRA
jgi:hypothetical protein